MEIIIVHFNSYWTTKISRWPGMILCVVSDHLTGRPRSVVHWIVCRRSFVSMPLSWISWFSTSKFVYHCILCFMICFHDFVLWCFIMILVCRRVDDLPAEFGFASVIVMYHHYIIRWICLELFPKVRFTKQIHWDSSWILRTSKVKVVSQKPETVVVENVRKTW